MIITHNIQNTQCVYTCPQTTVLCTAEIIPVQDVPSPLEPVLHVHVKLPSLFVQSALASQLLSPSGAHSSISNDHHIQYHRLGLLSTYAYITLGGKNMHLLKSVPLLTRIF